VDVSNAAVSVGNANLVWYYRVTEAGTISKLRLYVVAVSGNICVAAYRNSGSGLASVPGTRLATSGSIVCPASGINDVSLGASVSVGVGDWLAIGADNNTATFTGSTGIGDGTLWAGRVCTGVVFPAPATPSTAPNNTNLIQLIGVP
jgi:hypothetical protein